MNRIAATAVPIAMCFFVGCGGVSDQAQVEVNDAPPAVMIVLDSSKGLAVGTADAVFAGPHGGEFVDLLDSHYRAELTHDWDSTQVSIYVVNRDNLQARPLQNASVELTVVVENEVRQFVLLADPQPGDPPGQSSKFSRQDMLLINWYETPGMMARLKVVADHRECMGFIVGHHHRHVVH